MAKFKTHLDTAIDVLNRALAADPVAMAMLFGFRTPCNEALANDPTIQVSNYRGEGNQNLVGPLGVINGLFGIDSRGWGRIQMLVNDDGTIVRFERTVQRELSHTEVSPAVMAGTEHFMAEVLGEFLSQEPSVGRPDPSLAPGELGNVPNLLHKTLAPPARASLTPGPPEPPQPPCSEPWPGPRGPLFPRLRAWIWVQWSSFWNGSMHV
jgi:hypothetical protein